MFFFYPPKHPVYEFHISREIRDFYNVDESLFAQNGNVIFTNYFGVRSLAAKMNKKRDLTNYPERTIKAGQLNAMGLIDEILHYIVGLYKEENGSELFADALKYINQEIGREESEYLLNKFASDFPPLSVYRREITVETYLSKKSATLSNKEIILEEIFLFYLANLNPAFSPFKELFDDTALGKETRYRKAMNRLYNFFAGAPFFGPDNQNLYDMLRTPAVKHPNSLTDQLEFIRKHWGSLLSKYIMRLLGSLDMIKEEEKAIFHGPAPTYLLKFGAVGEEEYERFSADLHWMPNVIMLAKSTYVWLDQLSKKYKRDITRLNQIPDEELDIIASRGFTALWLIGLWERSPASQKIKQLCGNPEAVSSAYSLYDYAIAHDLGGDEAMHDLRTRAWRRGIRMASDMVPNHMGLFSRWIIEHPHWFIQSDHPIYPGYSFSGPNLSDDERVGLYIEDGYWNRSDAAVLFKRVDHHTGDTRYIYHGNDGTSMPWNDTAQLNFLMAEVREGVIQTILHVARQFPIIRLDAAMTLAKKHFQRLWFPHPGSGGDIPSRSEFAVSSEEFNRLFPTEFWREVVDRVAQEVPDTLLLAEAFWMMEGYFVRTLGMHRVYNSAFMNMLKNEENQKYRQAIKDVMDFNPEIMKRYVNFMNNPDEETAVAQFGKDDKYFGVCILMVTLPGLPMFGHGQIEGFTEKYGMEYRRSYWDETEDQHLIQRHTHEIFPLLRMRHIFSEVQNFVLYDFVDDHGSVNENVFAYSNRAGRERALIIYNNKYDRASGWVRYSSASAQKAITHSVRSGLNLNPGSGSFTIFRDHISGLEYIRNNQHLEDQGIFAILDGFKYHVFTDFREVSDDQYHHYAQITEYLNGRGVPSIEIALKETFLAPVHAPLYDLFSSEIIKILKSSKISTVVKKNFTVQFQSQFEQFVNELQKYFSISGHTDEIVQHTIRYLDVLLKLKSPGKIFTSASAKSRKEILTIISDESRDMLFYYTWLVTQYLGALQDKNYTSMISLSWMDELLLSKIIHNKLTESGYSSSDADYYLNLIKSMVIHTDWYSMYRKDKQSAVRALFEQPESNKFIQVNRYQGVLYFNKESFDRLANALFMISILRQGFTKSVLAIYDDIVDIKAQASSAGYRVEEFVRMIRN